MRVAVCDDEPVMLNMLSEIIMNEFAGNGCQCEMIKFTSGNNLLKEHNMNFFDVLFLDIHMPDIDGFGVAKAIRNISDKTFIIFVTTQEELIYDSFDFQPFNFVKKESGKLTERRLASIIKKLLRHHKQFDSFMLEPAFEEKRIITVRDVVVITSDKNYIEYILTDGKKYKIRGTLGESETRFADYDFVKTHRSFLVNMKHIEKINYTDCEIKLTNGNLAHIGKSYKISVDEKYTSYQRSLR